MLFSLRSGYRNAAVFRIGTGNRTIPEFLLFRESVTLRGTDPTLQRACGTRAVRGSTGWQEACKRLVAVRNAGSAALRKTYGRANRFPGTGLHSFFPNGYGRAVRAGYSGQSPILVRAPTHRQVRSFHSFLSDCWKNDPSISSFPTSRALILRAGSFKAAAPVPCAAEKGFHFTNGNQDTRFRDSLNRRRDPPVRDRLRCGFP